MEASKMKMVYTITERGEKSWWTKIGVAYVNRDGSLNVKLEAMPVNGTLHVRDWVPREDQPNGETRRGAGNNGGNGGGPYNPMPPADDLPEAFS